MHKLLFLLALEIHNFQQYVTLYPYLTLQKGMVRKILFCETQSLYHIYLTVYFRFTFPNSIAFGILLSYIFVDLHKTRGYQMPYSRILFDPRDLPPAIKYDILFNNLPPLTQRVAKKGRRPIERNALLKALVYKSLRGLSTLSDLALEIDNNPAMAQTLGFNPIFANHPMK
jgi:hypothetical protein